MTSLEQILIRDSIAFETLATQVWIVQNRSTRDGLHDITIIINGPPVCTSIEDTSTIHQNTLAYEEKLLPIETTPSIAN